MPMRKGPIKVAWALDQVAMNGPFQDITVAIQMARGVGVADVLLVDILLLI